jgi:tight adherence protein C
MEAVFDLFSPLSAGRPPIVFSVFVFVAATALAIAAFAALIVRGDVRRRTATLGMVAADPASDPRSLRHASLLAAQRLIEYANRYFSPAGEGEMRELRRRLVQAGFLDPRAGAYYFIARVALAAGLAVVTFVSVPVLLPEWTRMVWPSVWLAAIAGYLAPKIYLDRRIARRRIEHRLGFPDFMDLLVVCADAGLSMEAALDRVGKELGDSYPSLSSNIYMTTLEIRAGRTMSEALEHFADRLGLEEARSFATLLQQSEELGSSLTEALRVYSDDMRHKRMALAEEKAYSLPAKLSVPLILCIFPVILIVILLPVYVRVKYGVY